jgi:hypothetical protein
MTSKRDHNWFTSKKATSVRHRVGYHNLGRPGGPCHVIEHIEKTPLPPRVKNDLVYDVHKGEDLDNSEASKLYDETEIKLGGFFFQTLVLTNHAQYRMDLRSVTVDQVKMALEEFEKWLSHRRTRPELLKGADRVLIEDLVHGNPVKFEANRTRLTLVVTMRRAKEVRLVSAWWTGKPNPKPPRPGECEQISKTASETLMSLTNIIAGLKIAGETLSTGKMACGGSCSCGGNCGCSGKDPSKDYWSEEGQGSEGTNWYESPEDPDDNWYDHASTSSSDLGSGCRKS